MKKIYSTLTVIFLFFISGNALAQSFLTSGYYTYTVPTGVTNISFDVQGAAGGQSSLGVSYGGGGLVYKVILQ